jgi:heptosyltransferase-2
VKNKILIIRFSSIGDIILTTPFIRQVRKTFPDAFIYYLVKKQFEELLKYNPHINRLLLYSKEKNAGDLREIKKVIKKERMNYIFDLHNNWRSNYLRRNIKAEYISHINKDKLKQIALVYFKKNCYNQVTAIPERYLQVAAGAGVVSDNKGLEIFWNDACEKRVAELLKKVKINENEDFVIISPGASFYTKRWPLEYFAKLVELIRQKFDYKILIIGNKDDLEWGKALSKYPDVFDFTSQLSLLETAVLIAKSRALISNDSAAMHMAAAVKTPVLAIFGSSVKEWGFTPYQAKHVIVEVPDLSCRPCSHIGKNRCPERHFRCMLDIKPEIVWDNFIKLIDVH